MAAQQLSDGNSEGVVIGQEGDKVAFFGGEPVAQAANFATPASTAPTNTSPYGFAQQQAVDLLAAVRGLTLWAKSMGFVAPDA